MADARSLKIAFVAHCLLNQNAKVQGLAGYPGVFRPVASMLFEAGVGLVQLPCPEMALFGPNRPLGTDTREQYDTLEYRNLCRQIAAQVVSEVSAYHDAGYRVVCLLGVEGSPSCSVFQVPRLVENDKRRLLPGRGIFIEILSRELEEAGLDVPMIGVPEVQEAGSLEQALAMLASAIGSQRT